MVTQLNGIEKNRLALLLHEYNMFDRRTSLLTMRLSTVVVVAFGLAIPVLIKENFTWDSSYTIFLSLTFAILSLLAFIVVSQMLVYKRHMVHLANIPNNMQ